LLAHLAERDRAGFVVQVGDVVELLEEVRAVMPNWAAGYKAQLPALARAAIGELAAARLLVPMAGEAEQWRATPGVHLWRVRVAHAARGTAGPEPGGTSGIEPSEGDA
jgi:hypothetical protein